MIQKYSFFIIFNRMRNKITVYWANINSLNKSSGFVFYTTFVDFLFESCFYDLFNFLTFRQELLIIYFLTLQLLMRSSKLDEILSC